VQGLLAVDHLDRMEVVGKKSAGISLDHGQLAPFGKAAFALHFAVVDPVVENVVLIAVHTGDAGPCRVVMRRLRLSGRPGRTIEREPAVGIFGNVK
jgi:hypothetical protein